MVRLLLSKGSNPNADYGGETALAIPANKGFTSIMKILIKKGANVNAGSKSDGITPLMDASVTQ